MPLAVRDYLKNLPSGVSASLLSLLSLSATGAVSHFADVKGFVQLPKDTLLEVAGCLLSFLFGLVVYSWQISEKSGKKEERKLRIQRWRDELESCETFNDFYKRPAYTELQCFLSKKQAQEMNRVIGSNNSITIIEDGPILTASTRAFIAYRNLIGNIEKQWGLI